MCQGGCRPAVSTHAVCSQWAVQLWWLRHPRHASRPSVCKPAHGVLHFGMLLCIAAVQAIHANNWVAGRASGLYALITAPLAPWPPFCAAGELPQADSGQGRPQVRAAAGATAAALPRLHCWWQPHRRNSSVCACAQQQRQQVIQQRRQAPAAALVPPSEQQQQQQPCTLAAAALPSRFILPPPAPIRACSCNALLSDH